jgi:hypothetical protein
MKTKRAVYHDGEPQNLAAAAYDSLEWLRWLQNHMTRPCLLGQEFNEERRRLRLAIESLEKELKPCLPPRFTETELPAAFDLDAAKRQPAEGGSGG